jgi:hypothetical protein
MVLKFFEAELIDRLPIPVRLAGRNFATLAHWVVDALLDRGPK